MAVRDRLLRRYARWLNRRPKTVVALAFLVTALSLWVSIAYLKTQTGILDLYSEDTPVNQRFLSYTKKFGAVESLILVFEGDKAVERQAAMDALAARMKADPQGYVQDLFYKIDLSLFKQHAFQFLSEAQAKALLLQAQAPDGGIRALFQAQNFGGFIAFLNESLEAGMKKGAPPGTDAAQEFRKLLQPVFLLRDFLDGQELSAEAITTRLETSPEERASIDDEGYLRTDDRKMHVMFVRPVDRKQDYKVDQKLLKWVREEIPAVEGRFPGVKIGVTGGPALNSDQFQISQKDMTLASIFAYTSTALIFILAFHSFARPFLGLLTLNLALTWVFGFTTLAIGHLNLFSLAFIVILVGQGTYYGVHVVARYEEELHRGRGVPAAIEETIAHVFGNISTSAITTAAAFYATTLVELKGFAELGWIAGTGVLLSALSMLFLLPAFLLLYDRRRSLELLKGAGELAEPPLKPWMLALRSAVQNHAVWVILAVSAVGLWGAYMFYSPRHGVAFDNNLLNLQAKDTEAVRYEKKLIETSLSPRAGIFMTGSLEEAERLAREAKALPTVQRVEWLGDIFPEGGANAVTTQALRRAILSLLEAPLAAPEPARLRSELERLRKNLEEVENQALGHSQGDKILEVAEGGIQAIGQILKKFPDAGDPATRKMLEASFLRPQLEDFQKLFFPAVRGMLRAAAEAPPMALDRVPAEIRGRFLSADGTYAVYAFPKVNIWERAPLEQFVDALRTVSPEVTGPPVMFYEILRLVRKDYFKAGFYSALAIFLIFLIEFRSLRYALLASLPLVIGVFSLFGLMSWLKISFNTANMIALPMILGIGADNGVHILARFREEGGRGIDFLFKSTGKALIITYLDSVTSFVGLAFANHQGLASLGQIVVIGLTCCTIAGIFFLPAVMSLVARRGAAKRASAGDFS
ncbi:MAG: MMPL family transporter [Deltaproteobacteria bacterium]|nr:MMPL family transporter [Deltaproteobacteria bacterium]